MLAKHGEFIWYELPTDDNDAALAFYMLEARDMNEAIRLAEKIPPARYGSVEIRPVRELMEQSNSR